MQKFWIYVPNAFGVLEWRRVHSFVEMKLAKKMGYLVAKGRRYY